MNEVKSGAGCSRIASSLRSSARSRIADEFARIEPVKRRDAPAAY